MAKNASHDAALSALIGDEDRAEYDRRVRALIARNALLEVIDMAREAAALTKKELAAAAGLEASSVRRLLTAQTANPTVENAFRLLGATGVRVEAVLPSGQRVSLLSGKPAPAPARTVAAPKAKAAFRRTTRTKRAA